MKKYIPLVLALLIITLTACNKDDSPTAPEDTTTETTTATTTTVPTTTTPPTTTTTTAVTTTEPPETTSTTTTTTPAPVTTTTPAPTTQPPTPTATNPPPTQPPTPPTTPQPQGFTQADVDWIIEESRKLTESFGMMYYPMGDLSNRDNGSWSGSIVNDPGSMFRNNKEGVFNQIKGQIELYASDGYQMITVDYNHEGNGIYRFYVIYG